MTTDRSEPQSPKAALLTLRIVWGALLFGVLVFMLVVGIILANTAAKPVDAQFATVLLVVLLALLVTELPIGYFVRMQVYKRSWQGDVISPSGYSTGNIILFACCESVALFALIVVLITRSYWPAIIPAVIAMAIMVVNFPNGRAMFPPGSFSGLDDRRDTL